MFMAADDASAFETRLTDIQEGHMSRDCSTPANRSCEFFLYLVYECPDFTCRLQREPRKILLATTLTMLPSAVKRATCHVIARMSPSKPKRRLAWRSIPQKAGWALAFRQAMLMLDGRRVDARSELLGKRWTIRFQLGDSPPNLFSLLFLF